MQIIIDIKLLAFVQCLKEDIIACMQSAANALDYFQIEPLDYSRFKISCK